MQEAQRNHVTCQQSQRWSLTAGFKSMNSRLSLNIVWCFTNSVGPGFHKLGHRNNFLTDWTAESCVFCNATWSSSHSFRAEIHVPMSQTSLYTWPMIETLNLAWRWGWISYFTCCCGRILDKGNLRRKELFWPTVWGCIEPVVRQRREIDVGAQLIFSFSSVKDPSPWDAASSIQSWIPPPH